MQDEEYSVMPLWNALERYFIPNYELSVLRSSKYHPLLLYTSDILTLSEVYNKVRAEPRDPAAARQRRKDLEAAQMRLSVDIELFLRHSLEHGRTPVYNEILADIYETDFWKLNLPRPYGNIIEGTYDIYPTPNAFLTKTALLVDHIIRIKIKFHKFPFLVLRKLKKKRYPKISAVTPHILTTLNPFRSVVLDAVGQVQPSADVDYNEYANFIIEFC